MDLSSPLILVAVVAVAIVMVAALVRYFALARRTPFKVTFDTNTFDKASRPAIYAKDPDHPHFVVVHNALKTGQIQGFISETSITLEGIGNDRRATVFGNTRTSSSFAQASEDTFTIIVKPVQLDRLPLHRKQVERLLEAFRLGIRLLGAPRIGMPRAEDQLYALEDPANLGDRLNRFFDLARQIEARDLGSVRAKKLAGRFLQGAAPKGPWFTGLGAAKNIHETREVARAIAEWADADSIAAHYAYGNDFFCTADAAIAETKRGNPAIFDASNRAWLTQQFGVQFLTLTDLAQRLRK
jgi:hypothetical protein